MRGARHNQRYLHRGKREASAEVARRLTSVIDAERLVNAAAANVEEVVRTQLVPTVLYHRETLQSFALAEFLATNGR